MSNYAESKQKLDAIRDKYGCKGEIILRGAIQYIVEFGQRNFNDEQWFDIAMGGIDRRHDQAEAEGKFLFITRDFEKAILECAKELAQIDPYDFLIYIQREIYLGGDGISYQRAIDLLRGCLDYCGNNTYEIMYTLEMAEEMGFDENEIEELGYGYMLNEEEEGDE